MLNLPPLDMLRPWRAHPWQSRKTFLQHSAFLQVSPLWSFLCSQGSPMLEPCPVHRAPKLWVRVLILIPIPRGPWMGLRGSPWTCVPKWGTCKYLWREDPIREQLPPCSLRALQSKRLRSALQILPRSSPLPNPLTSVHFLGSLWASSAGTWINQPQPSCQGLPGASSYSSRLSINCTAKESTMGCVRQMEGDENVSRYTQTERTHHQKTCTTKHFKVLQAEGKWQQNETATYTNSWRVLERICDLG